MKTLGYVYYVCIFVVVMFVVLLALTNATYVDKEQKATTDSTTVVIESTGSVKPHYTVTEEERTLLAKLAHSEASVCSVECQQDVVSVVFNRLESGKWRKDMNGDNKITVYDIIYYPNAFTPATNGAIDKWEPTSKDYAAVDYVIKNGPTVPTEVRYFRTDCDFSWDGYENYKVIDNVYFGYFVDWQKGAW